MMRLSDFKKWLNNQKDKNKTVKQIERGIQGDRFFIVLYFFMFFFCSFICVLAAVVYGDIIGFAVVGVFISFVLIILIGFYLYRKMYLFLRKAFNMFEKEEFDE